MNSKFKFATKSRYGISGLIDWGYKGLHIVEDHGDYIIFKVPGHLGWGGIGYQKYYETKYFIGLVLKWDAEYTWVEEQEQRFPGKKWHSCIRYLRKLIKEKQGRKNKK